MLLVFILIAGCFTSSTLSVAYGGVEKCRELCSTGSCCETSWNKFECCNYVNGVCCPGGNTCCPQGSTCSVDGLNCEYTSGALASQLPLVPHQQSNPVNQINQNGYVMCSDRISVCPDNSTCCSMGNETWGCCNMPNAICCSDSLHCCPQNTKCNHLRHSCDPLDAPPTSHREPTDPSWPQLMSSRASASALNLSAQAAALRMSYDGVQCSDSLECPLHTTCCHNKTGEFACCPMPDATCCSDGSYCCPKGTVCDSEASRCISQTDVAQTNVLSSFMSDNRGHQLCPDRQAVCLDDQTCCKLHDDSWGCCPVPDAVCCSDGEHCCPAGFWCDLSSQRCEKNVPLPPKTDVVCPNASFHCSSTSTCCPLPHQEWACCPFEHAVCCSDMLHCCPGNTTCDLAHGQCVETTSASLRSMDSIKSTSKPDTCSSGLVYCPSGTCCKNVFGMDACCPYSEAVCCNSGRCCPKGTRCDDSTNSCLPSDSISVPWNRKVAAQQLTPLLTDPADTLCPDGKSICPEHQSCCRLIDHSFGCCPLANGTCCADLRHCCPHGSDCAENSCVRKLAESPSQVTIKAERMVSVADGSPSPSARWPEHVQSGANAHAQFCGLCEHDWLCCPDATGQPNRKCCPEPGRVCCPDGEHCCPKGTTCLPGGQCAPFDHHLEFSSRVLLGPSRIFGQTKAQFLDHHLIKSEQWPALMAFRARLNVLYLLPGYYRMYFSRHTVCPDRERYCELNQKCCASTQHGYVCVPKDATCCYPALDTWCPVGSYCSDGRSCKKQPDWN